MMLRRVENSYFGTLGIDDMRTYFSLYKIALNRPLAPERGFTVDEMRMSIGIIDIIEGHESNNILGSILLTDEQFQHLERKLDKFPFAMAHRDILTMIDSFKTSDVFDPNEEKE